MRESKKVEAFLLKFGIEFSEEFSHYMSGWNGERGKSISSDAIRKIKEFYFKIQKPGIVVKSLGCQYYPLSSMDGFITSISDIIEEINLQSLTMKNKRIDELQYFKDSSTGLWCTDKEPIDKTDFWELK